MTAKCLPFHLHCLAHACSGTLSVSFMPTSGPKSLRAWGFKSIDRSYSGPCKVYELKLRTVIVVSISSPLFLYSSHIL